MWPQSSCLILTVYIQSYKCGHFDLNVFTSSFLIRSAFLAAHIPLFLYPFLHTVSKTRPFEYLRLTSLGVIGNLYPSLRCFIFWLRAISTKLCLYLSHKAVSLCLLQVPWWKQMNKKWLTSSSPLKSSRCASASWSQGASSPRRYLTVPDVIKTVLSQTLSRTWLLF